MRSARDILAPGGTFTLPSMPSQVIDGTCPEHGEFTRSAWIAAGAYSSTCPVCFAAAQEKAKREEQSARALNYLTKQSGIPRRFLEKNFADFQPATREQQNVFAVIKHYAETFPMHAAAGRSLILYGKTGAGKTHLACSVLRHIALQHGQTGKYTTAYHIVRDIKACYSDRDMREADVIAAFVEPDILAVDEVGVQFGSDTEKMLLFEVINGRYEDMKPTIVIANLDLGEFKNYLGDRVMDRLRENGGAALPFTWPSHRGGKNEC